MWGISASKPLKFAPIWLKKFTEKLNRHLMICENIFKFVRDNGYNSYINTPKMDYIM